MESETALREFPCKTIGGSIRSQNKFKVEISFKSWAKQCNKKRKLHFSVPILCWILTVKSNSFQSIMVFFLNSQYSKYSVKCSQSSWKKFSQLIFVCCSSLFGLTMHKINTIFLTHWTTEMFRIILRCAWLKAKLNPV